MAQTRWSSATERTSAAAAAFGDLGEDKRKATVLDIQCDRGHHLAKVYRTAIGPVFVAANRSRSHGRRDLPDTGHNAGRIDPWVDLLGQDGDPLSPDALPAWCDCGGHNLAPQAVSRWIDDGERRVVIDG